MSKTIARKTAFETVDYLRAVIVLACAGALILAGEFAPLSL
jgi:hypothetical protein